MQHVFRVIGAGVWGLAFSDYLLKMGHEVEIFCRDTNLAINDRNKFQHHSNLAKHVKPLSNLSKYDCSDAINIIATNSNGFSDLFDAHSLYFNDIKKIVWLTKGLDHKTGKLFSEYLQEKFGQMELALLSGPSFAEDLNNGLDISISLASNSKSLSNELFELISSKSLKLELTPHLQAIEIASCLKNITAILCGISDNIFSDNKSDLLIKKACDEVLKIYQLLGNVEVNDDMNNIVNSPGCIGDMNLTCKQEKSRNYRFGKLISDDSFSIDDALAKIGTVEGYECCITLIEKSITIQSTIASTLYRILSKPSMKKDYLLKLLQA
jgi:glycerol-3-phosphate dehydrogenase (NAD(P)+)